MSGSYLREKLILSIFWEKSCHFGKLKNFDTTKTKIIQNN